MSPYLIVARSLHLTTNYPKELWIQRRLKELADCFKAGESCIESGIQGGRVLGRNRSKMTLLDVDL
jgi:hypothetical protein